MWSTRFDGNFDPDLRIPCRRAFAGTAASSCSGRSGIHSASRHVLVFDFCFIVLAGIFAITRHSPLAKVVVGLGIVLIPLQPTALYLGVLWLTTVHILLFIAFLLLLSWIILARVFGRSRINLHCILGAVAVYLHLGLIFALLGTLLVLHVSDGATALPSRWRRSMSGSCRG